MHKEVTAGHQVPGEKTLLVPHLRRSPLNGPRTQRLHAGLTSQRASGADRRSRQWLSSNPDIFLNQIEIETATFACVPKNPEIEALKATL